MRPPSSTHYKMFNAAKHTDVAQRQRAGLITPRSLVRTGSSVFSLLYPVNIIMVPYFILRGAGYVCYYTIYFAYSCVSRLLLTDPAAIVLIATL